MRWSDPAVIGEFKVKKVPKIKKGVWKRVGFAKGWSKHREGQSVYLHDSLALSENVYPKKCVILTTPNLQQCSVNYKIQ